MKKIIAFILTVVMILSLAVPAVAGEEVIDIPVIYVGGKNPIGLIMNKDGTEAYSPKTLDRAAYIKERVTPVLKELPSALLTDDYSSYIDALVDSVAPIYKDWVLDEKGSTETSGSYINWDYKTAKIASKKSGYELMDYVFQYDWRLSPLETADQLNEYINRVMAVTGAKKVSIYGRCLGSNIVMAFLAKEYNGDYGYAPNGRIQNILFNTAPIAGYIAVGALFSGSIKLDADRIDKFVTYYFDNNDVFDDPLMSVVTATMVTILNYGRVLGWSADQIQTLVDRVMGDALPKIALSCYGSFPSYWSMVSDKYYDKALNAVFNTDELRDKYSVFIDKVEAYNELVSKVDKETGLTGYERILLDYKNTYGVNTAVYAKYGYASVPLFDDSDLTGDTRGTVTELGFGANATVIGKTFSKDYLEKAKDNNTEKYISADHTVDASTGLFPDTTWYIKAVHDDFPDQLDTITMNFYRSNGKYDVEQSASDGFTRFMDYQDGKLIPVEKEDEKLWSNDGFSVLHKFIMMVIRVLIRLFKRAA